ncbi:EIIAB-Man [Raoultella terrigena]|uniref:EIIAB-Man n=1 Tax=Raoultella terrigena TaxID=577 RepID=A0A4U9D7Z8_RAOTE|nr:EIIAB-Man [Raoultella terrigena]
MLGIILTGHGGFASGMAMAMKQILGEQSQFIAIDFPETSTTALLTSQLEQAVSQLDAEDDIVFLTDLLGGTPFRVASTLAMPKTRKRSDYRHQSAAAAGNGTGTRGPQRRSRFVCRHWSAGTVG